MRRPIARIFVINPPALGKKRRRDFEKQFQKWSKQPPPISYVGVNKNHLDLSESSKYRHLSKLGNSAARFQATLFA